MDQEADFIGKAALQRIKAEGVKQKLVGLTLAGERIPGNEHYWPLLYNKRPVGEVTSSTYSPRLEKNIALAFVPIEHSAVGTPFVVDSPHGANRCKR